MNSATDRPQPLTQLGWLDFHGSDAGDFLHRQLSSDVLSLPVGSQRLGAWCNNHGQVLAVLWLGRVAETHYRAVLAAGLLETVSNGLRRYVLRDDVRLEAGQGAMLGLAKQHEGDWQHPLIENAWLHFTPAGSSAADTSELIQCDAWHKAELQAGLSWLGAQQSGRWLPQMLGHEALGLLDYHKGCYPGQEIIARAHFLGRVKRGLVLLQGTGALISELRDANDRPLGEVIDRIESGDGWLGLAVMNLDAISESEGGEVINHPNIRYLKNFSAKLEQA